MMRYQNFFLFVTIATLFLTLSCKQQQASRALFEQVPGTGINFTNTVKHSKDFNIFTFRNFYNGGGVAIGDINNDGLADVFFTANMGSNKLYLNKGNWKFDDISASAGFTDKQQWSTGVVFVDINNDGWLDIFVANSAHINDGISRANQLFINNHNLTFTDSAQAYGLDNAGYTTQASFFDYDLDGDLDCFLVNNTPIPVNTLNYANKRDLPAGEWPVADFLKGGGDHLYRNDNGKFTEVTKSAGIHGSLISLGLGITVGDINEDGYPDIYVSNDFFERDYLYINQKNGTFTDEFEKCLQHTSLSSMGADIADINNDGYPDIFTTDMLPDNDYRLKTTSSFENIDVYRLKEKNGFFHQYMQNTLQLNNRDGGFSDIAYYSGVAASDWSWGALAFDADNDSHTDIFVCNGIYLDVTDQDFIDFFANDIIQRMVMTGKKEEVDSIINKMPSHAILNKAFKNTGNLKFTDASTEWGFTQASFSNGAAYGDLDNDGDLDLIINNVNEPAFIYRNNSREQSSHHYIGITLKGKGKNTFAIGSKIKLYTGNQVISREVIPSRGFQSSVDYKTIIGLGAVTNPDSMVVIWPDQSRSLLHNLSADSVYILQQPNSATPAVPAIQPVVSPTLFTGLVNVFDRHQEDDYIDFYYERNIPELLSREGPRAAVADVNGDGYTDVYIGGAAGQPGQLYLQTATGYTKKEEPVFKQFADFEDVAVTFFDCDKDGDMDLFIGSGGNNIPPGRRQLQHRLYKNDGNGNFDIDINAFPQNDMDISVVAVNDFDNDGDPDLFVGGRDVPGSYGYPARSYIYRNDGKGHFTDVTNAMNPLIASLGMVTGAAWADINGDKQKELVITGEWMHPYIFSYDGKQFQQLTTGMEEWYGWWKTVAVTDLDADGDEDLVLGNMGENFYLEASDQQPVMLWINDFDQNGVVDKILTRTVDGKNMPVFLKREITEQLPSLKSQNLKHQAYAGKSMNELFGKDLLDKSQVKKVNLTSSGFAINDGKGHFTFQSFPAAMQLTCINTVLCADVNNDNRPDILAGGNNFGFQPQFGRLDAAGGMIAVNKGQNKFTVMAPAESGVSIQGEVRDIVCIPTKSGTDFLFLRNDDYPVSFLLVKAGDETKK